MLILTGSLGEFGTHVSSTKNQSPVPKPKTTPTMPPSTEAEFNEVFSEEFAAQAQVQLGEAMKMMQSENPELWKQFEQFSTSLGMPSSGAPSNSGGMASHSNSGGAASHGESSTDDQEKGRGSDRTESLEGVLQDTLQKLKLNAEGLAVSGFYSY